ncbi:MAG: response regulator transcription factor [Alphaproteobacteria bacterium]|nr:response regulator transcription factor [Alphaproteobacteria bacterium]
MVRIMIVDDDDLFRESVAQNLTDHGFEVETLANGEDACASLKSDEGIDLVLLDWKMPGMTGIEVLTEMRANKIDIPVIFFTVLSDQIYEEVALASGAVDFVEKSRSFHILLRRIELILGGAKSMHEESTKNDGPDSLKLGELDLRPDSGRAYWKGQEVDLTLGEFRIVHCLASRAGQDVRYRDLYDEVHGSGFVAGEGPEGFRTNVRTFIKRIRQKFRNIDPDFNVIENYPGFGYRWRHDG